MLGVIGRIFYYAMLAEITFDNIFSGLVGAFIGVFVSFGINWWNALRNAKDKLRELLLSLKDYQFANVDGAHDTARERYIKSYPEILSAVIAYRSLLMKPDRETLTGAFGQYRGITDATRNYAKFIHQPPGDQGALDTRINAMLAALNYHGE